MTGFLATLTERFGDALERRRNRPFLCASMAACALVATADGKVTFVERVRVDQILQTLEALRVFDPHEGVDLFNEFVDAILASPRDGHERALAAIAEVSHEAEAAELLIRMCCAVSEAKGAEKALVDQIEIVSLCSRLGVEPTSCGLYAERPPDELLR